jgi:hypothetical protein
LSTRPRLESRLNRTGGSVRQRIEALGRSSGTYQEWSFC